MPFQIMTIRKVFKADRVGRIIYMKIVSIVSNFTRPDINTRLIEGDTRFFVGRHNISDNLSEIMTLTDGRK